MAILQDAITLSGPAELIYTAQSGSNGAMQGFLVTNMDASIDVFIGGPTVTIATGTVVNAGGALGLDLLAGELVYAIPASGTPEVRILVTQA